MGDSDFSGWFVAPRTNLSPFAQAIWDALDMGDLSGPQQLVALAHAVCVLRAAADHIDHDWSAFNCVDSLCEIAAELEGING